MRHRKKRTLGLGRDKNRQVMKNLNAALILNETIKVSLKRGKLIKSAVEKLITIGKVDTLHKKRQLFAQLPGPAARKVYEVLGPKYKDRNGGYTRVMLTGRRRGDNAQMAILEFVEKPVKESTPKKKEKEKATQLKEKEYAVEKEVAKAGEVREEEKLVKTKEEPAKEVKPKKEKPVHPQRPGKKPGFFKKFFGQKKGM